MDLQVSLINKAFRKNGNVTPILSDVAFSVPAGSITCMYGPSGCGKSTLLRIIAGLDTDYDGEVRLNGNYINGPTRDIGLTVQSIVSYDWLTVAGNISFGLRYSGEISHQSWFKRILGKIDPELAATEAARLADIVGLSSADLQKYPEEISGGMKQRMAFARALVAKPKVLLLDEPFSALDYESRQALQDIVHRVRREFGTSFVCVSHDPGEVLYLADQVIVLSRQPATVIHSYTPSLPYYGDTECRYTTEFQHAKKELHEWLNPTSQIERRSRTLKVG